MSIVSVSRFAGPPHCGQSTLTQSVAAASGEVPLDEIGARQVGQLNRKLTIGTGTSPHRSQWMIGIGQPQ